MMEKYMFNLSKQDTKILKGIAILFMVGLHLYNRIDINGYYSSLININGNPLIYYVSFLFDACVPIYCFCSGYAAYASKEKTTKYVFKRLLKLLINYWIVLVLTIFMGIIFNEHNISKNIFTLLGNVFLYDITYVGAWWFMQTYVLLTLSSKMLCKVVGKCNVIITLGLVSLIYVGSYYFRIISPITVNIKVIQLIINALVLYGTSVFPYVIGMTFNQYNVAGIIRNKARSNLLGFSLIIVCIILHIIVKSMFIAPFVGTLFIIAYIILDINGIVRKVLLYFGDHSTNIWLIHMQIYMIYLSDIVFCTNTIIGCFLITIMLSLMFSYLIKYIQSLIYRIIK